MKVTLEFNLPEDEEKFNVAFHAKDYKRVLNDLVTELRDRLKYDPPKNKKEYGALNGVYVRLFKLAEEYGITIW